MRSPAAIPVSPTSANSTSSSGALQRRLLRLPLPLKILYANIAIVTLGAIAGTVITVWHVRTYPDDIHYELIALFVAAGVILSLLINGWVLKLALAPLDRLQDAVDLVSQGQPGARVTFGVVTDDRFDRLGATFNSMLDRLEQDAAELQQLSRRLIGAQEAERLRLARELHDEAAQGLTSLLVRLRLLERAQAPDEAQRRVQELREITATALEDVRRVALDLRPTILDDLGLASALEWRVDEFNKESAVKSTVEIVGMERRLPREIELALYRVGQEALSNVHRHAQATEVHLRIVRAGDRVTIEIKDNGTGFLLLQHTHGDLGAPGSEGAPMPEHGIGLLGMRERVAALGGELTIISAPGQGTTIRAVTPAGAAVPATIRQG